MDSKFKILHDEENKFKATFSYPVEESNKGNFTASSKSAITFEESN
jgi:hypothetical protein